jgi:hypothetical protein
MKTFRSTLLAGVLLLSIFAVPALAGLIARQAEVHNMQQPQSMPPPRPVPPRAAAAPPAPAPPAAVAIPMQDDRGARETREWFRKVLEQYPPSVRQVLQIDTSLLSRPDYLATYPALAAFLEQHPEVAHNPAYLVGTFEGGGYDDRPQNEQIEAIRAWRAFGEFIPVVAIVFIITSALAGVIRTLIDQRRWQRAARMHMELQNKLLDRFGTSGELLGYLETRTGRGLADLQLPGLVSPARQMDAPTTRIFWPLQTGIVLTAAGIGLHYLGNRVGFTEVRQPISGFGELVVAIGLGFIVSAIASFFLSHRLGLMPVPERPELGRGTPDA